MSTQLSDRSVSELACVDEFWFSPSGGAGLNVGAKSATRPGPSLTGLRVGGRRAPKRLLAALAAGVVVVLVAAFFVMRMGGNAEGQVFRYALTQGEKQSYDLSITVSGVVAGVPNAPPIQGTISATMGYEVLSAQPDGTSQVRFTVENLRSEPAGALPPGPGGASLDVTIAPDGSVTDVTGAGGIFSAAGASMDSLSGLSGSPSDTAGSQFMFPQFPADEKIAEGDSWNEKSSFPLPFGDNTVTVTSTGTHNGFQDSPYGQVAKFHHSMSAPMDMEFKMADMFKAMADAFGGQAQQVPPEVANVVMKITGDMSMDADSLVIPDTSELVQLDGTAKTSMRIVMEGVPQGAGAPPDDMAMDMTMKIQLLRVGGAPSTKGAASADDAAPASDGTSPPGGGAASDEGVTPSTEGLVPPGEPTAPTGEGTTPVGDAAPVVPKDQRPPGYGDDPPVEPAAQVNG